VDSLTHIALGACMGEAFAGKKLGRKAMLWGAMAQSAPDIDFLAGFWMDTPSNLLAQPGIHTFIIILCDHYAVPGIDRRTLAPAA
jgi:inner membrane protein